MKGSIRQRSPGSWELTIDLGRGTRGEAGAGCGSKCGNGAGDAPYPATGSTPAPSFETSSRPPQAGFREFLLKPSLFVMRRSEDSPAIGMLRRT